MKKKIWLAGLTAAVILLAWRWSGIASGNVEAFHEYPIGKYYRFMNVDSEGIIQEIMPVYNYLESIELFLVFADGTDGKIKMVLENDEGRNIFHKKYKISQIPTGEVYEYKINEKLTPGETYRLCISYDGEAEELPQIMVSEKAKNLVETGTMMVQGEPSDYYNAAISYRYRWKSFWGFGY